MRLIGLDHGARRIGISIGDSETGMAFSRPALRRRGDVPDVAALVELARREGSQLVVVGLPRNMDGSEGQQATRARAFGGLLRDAGLTVVFVDERLSSWEAGERLAASGRHPGRASGELDSAAAQLILQEYLRALGQPGRATEGR